MENRDILKLFKEGEPITDIDLLCLLIHSHKTYDYCSQWDDTLLLAAQEAKHIYNKCVAAAIYRKLIDPRMKGMYLIQAKNRLQKLKEFS